MALVSLDALRCRREELESLIHKDRQAIARATEASADGKEEIERLTISSRTKEKELDDLVRVRDELNWEIDKLEEDIDHVSRMVFHNESLSDDLDKIIRENIAEQEIHATRMANDDGMESTKKRKEPPTLSHGSRRLPESLAQPTRGAPES